ncbi:dimethylsulfoxide reductase [Photobacterium sanctipauli]|uniref:Dimethylsulfoxide reductase n=1 Tax=Photobacterium sanctipauli TaxID=1342794 RepID=A0A2T3NV62_9GAMM|nr:DmsC/YnfH family molybdoenzyme membrane anchor subunit [Photobacterium sanctipauli]PSW20108.1 dimethylsulfoxide reductase [Photobacterium sanctipauli]
MAWYEWPFILSNVFSQLAVGAFIVLGFVILSGKLCFGQLDRLHKTMQALWLLFAVALLLREGSMMLSSSEAAYQFSHEAFMTAGFFVSALLYWFAEKALFASDTVRKGLLMAVIALGVLYLANGLLVRSEQWLVASHFLATTLCGGALLAHSMLIRAQHKVEELNGWLPKVGAVIAVICLVTGLPQMVDLIYMAEQHNEAAPFVAQVISLGLLIAAVGVWFMPTLTKSKPVFNVMSFAMVMMFFSSYFAGVGY